MLYYYCSYYCYFYHFLCRLWSVDLWIVRFVCSLVVLVWAMPEDLINCMAFSIDCTHRPHVAPVVRCTYVPYDRLPTVLLYNHRHQIRTPEEWKKEIRRNESIWNEKRCDYTYSIMMKNASIGWYTEWTTTGYEFPHKMIASLNHRFRFANIFRSLLLWMQFRSSTEREKMSWIWFF